jgi:GGDEF domain-containing protein
MLKLNNFSKYIEHFGDAASTEQFQSLRNKIDKILPNTARAVRYASNKILIILPEVFESDLHDLEDSIKFSVEETFKNKDKIDVGPEISVIDCSDESKGFLTLLSLIE